MVSKLAVLSNILLASASVVLGGILYPSELDHAHRHENRESQLINRAELDANTQYSSFLAGVSQLTWNGTITTVTGTFTVPSPLDPSTPGMVSVGISIDYFNCPNAFLNTGIIMVVNGSVSYGAWYERYPDIPHGFFDPIEISAGDVIKATAISSSSTSGMAIIENLTTGQKSSENLTSTHPLCQGTAGWLVADPSKNGLLRLSDFGTVTFTDAIATGGCGTIDSPTVSIDMKPEDGAVIVSTVTNGATITIKHI